MKPTDYAPRVRYPRRSNQSYINNFVSLSLCGDEFFRLKENYDIYQKMLDICKTMYLIEIRYQTQNRWRNFFVKHVYSLSILLWLYNYWVTYIYKDETLALKERWFLFLSFPFKVKKPPLRSFSNEWEGVFLFRGRGDETSEVSETSEVYKEGSRIRGDLRENGVRRTEKDVYELGGKIKLEGCDPKHTRMQRSRGAEVQRGVEWGDYADVVVE